MQHHECAVQRHQSPERPILHQISSLIYPKIQRRQVIMNVIIQVVHGCLIGRLQFSGGSKDTTVVTLYPQILQTTTVVQMLQYGGKTTTFFL